MSAVDPYETSCVAEIAAASDMAEAARIRDMILRDLEDYGYLTPVSLISAPYKQKQPLDPTADVTPDASAVDHTRARREQ